MSTTTSGDVEQIRTPAPDAEPVPDDPHEPRAPSLESDERDGSEEAGYGYGV